MQIEKSLAKHLAPLGHEVTLWHEAIQLLRTRLAKGRVPEPLGPFLQLWLPSQPPAPPPLSPSLLLGQDDSGRLFLHGSSAPFATDPAWRALLHLPALRSAWVADLRASHFDHLRLLIPPAWLLDPAPLPPGAVIAGLGIPDWSAFDPAGRAFSISSMDDPAAAPTELPAALAAGRHVLSEILAPVQQWRAVYVRDQSGIHLRDIAPL
jgi:hypothetical protein